MKIEVEKFIAITVVLAAGMSAAQGCVSNNTNDSGGSGGSAGAAGSGAGSAGTSSAGASGSSAGSGGSPAGAGGTPGGAGGEAGSTAGAGGSTAGAGGSAAGAGGSAGGDAAACLGDTATDVDASAEGLDCSTLPYAADICPGDIDAGTEDSSPLGAQLCSLMSVSGRPGVNEAMLACLTAIAGDSCADPHGVAVQACVDDVFGRACETGDVVSDGGTFSCATYSGTCSTVTVSECQQVLNAFTEAARHDFVTCVGTPVGTCEEDFRFCSLPL